MGYEDGHALFLRYRRVSKDRLDVVVLPEGRLFSVSNDTAGWAELVVRLRPLTVSAIGLEPSGGYERGIIRALLAAGMSVRRINPNKLRQFARARGVLAKNDRLDARLIAEYVAIMPTRAVQRDAAVERLAEIVTMRDSCVTSMLRPRTRRLISKMPC
jgi:transposase